jgi:aldehyde dehydrogenase family 7 protein A1
VHREGNFVTPTIFEVAANSPLLKEELFMPVLFVVRFDSIEEAIHINNNVPQGLSSTMFT